MFKIKKHHFIGGVVCILLFTSCDNRKRGCTDPNAPNYDPMAEADDGDCIYPTSNKKVALFFFSDSESSSCGSFGVPLFDQAITSNGSNIVPIALYPSFSDTLFSGAGVNIASTYSVTGYPDFAAGSQSNLLTINAINSAISTSLQENPIGNVDGNFGIFGDSIKISLFGKFFTSDSGYYYAAAYLLEDNINLPQAGITDPNFRHNHVLRASTGSSGIGDQVYSGVVTSSTSFKKEYSIYIQPNWNTANLKIVAVLWRQNGSLFEFVNVNDQ